MFISLQGTEWHGTKFQITYRTYVCRCQLFLPALLSAPQLVETWSSLVTACREPSIQRRRSCGVEQFAAGHSYCINNLFFQKSAQDSSIFFIHFNYLLNSEKRMLYGALVVTLWTCYGAL